ncbi:DUF1310 family protein [Streptococcus ferus]|uniref:DUF1310 family protein n=1 Tax=Streptococcus ferus TaxID=1345 RepID=UPI002355F4D7|nr:DUF1310 family protein [Streptococcus ferus]
MKKGLKVLICLLAIIGIGVGGFAVHQHQEKEKMIKIATSEEAKKVYEEFIKKRDPKAFTEEGVIQTYEVDESSLKYNPMGGLMVVLIINKNQELDISYNLVDKGDGTYYSAFYTISPKLSNVLREVK